MKVRYKADDGHWIEGSSRDFNTHGVGEVVVNFDEDGADSVMISDLEIQLPSGEWKDMGQAFKDRDIVGNNYETYFDIPHSEAEKKQGYNW